MSNKIIALKRAYRLWHSVEPAYEYGPLRSYAYEDHKQIDQLWRSVIDPAIADMQQTSRKDTEGKYIVEAPSAWHAYFYLRAQQQNVYRSGRPLYEPESTDRPAGPEHMYFRGQRCADWEFQSSLRRKDLPAQTIEKKAVTALDEYFRSIFVADENLANITASCFAQHYGIATDLADISCDPDIAIWFATHPVGTQCPSGEAKGVVRAVTWAAQERGTKTFFLLPPPFVRNVYIQRGLFIDTSSNSGILQGSITLEIRFPRETVGGEFQVIRKRKPLEVWPEPDESEKELVKWAREIGANGINDKAVRTSVQKSRNENSLPKFWLEKRLFEPHKQINAWLSILDWVIPATCVTAMPALPEDQAPMRYEILNSKVKALARANPSLFKAFISASEGTTFSGYFQILKHVLLIAKEELEKS